MLRKIAPNLWVFDSTFCVYCFKGSTRMTIIRLKNGDLWIHSPVQISEKLKNEINKIGNVKYVIAPNNMHYLYFEECFGLFPDVQGYVTQSLIKKKKQFKKYKDACDLNGLVGNEIKQLEFQGHTLGEMVFFHKSSKTLILTDLLYNLQPHNLWFEKWIMWIFGAYGKPSIPIYHKVSMRDKNLIRASVSKIIKWPIKRIIMAHGDIITGTNTGETFRNLWYSLLRE